MSTTDTVTDCGYCGCKAKAHGQRRGNYRRTGTNYQVGCNGCRCRGPLCDTEAEAVLQWNEMQALMSSGIAGS